MEAFSKSGTLIMEFIHALEVEERVKKIDLHNNNHAVNLDCRQYLYPQNDYLQSNKDNDQHITSFTCFCYHLILIICIYIYNYIDDFAFLLVGENNKILLYNIKTI